jgi:hypothetical protein
VKKTGKAKKPFIRAVFLTKHDPAAGKIRWVLPEKVCRVSLSGREKSARSCGRIKIRPDSQLPEMK